MTSEQQIRFEIIKLIIQSNPTYYTKASTAKEIVEQAEELLKWIVARNENQIQSATEHFVENPLNLKVHTTTGIPVEFS